MTVPIGTIMAYGGLVDSNAKGQLERQGWLVCDGENYLENDYPELENTIGVMYGTSRPGMFHVPDLRGRFVRGVDHGTQRDPDASSRGASAPGGNTGDKVGSVQEAQSGFKWANKIHGSGGYWGAFPSGPAPDYKVGECRPVNIYVNWIIKAKDVS